MPRLTSEKYILNVLDFFKIKHQGQVSTKLLNTLARELSVRTLPRNKAEAMNKLREAFITWRLVNRKTLQTRPPEKGTIKTEKVVPKITEEEQKPRVRLNQEQGTIGNPIDEFLDKLPLYTTPSQASDIVKRMEKQRAKKDATAEKIKKVQAETQKAIEAEKAEKAEKADEPEPPKKKRGRPKKEPAPEPDDVPIPEL